MSSLPRFTATEYLQPLREGGSLPAVVDTDGGLFVAKFRAAGQGPRALIAEVVVGLLAVELGLPVPEIAEIVVPHGLAADQRDPEIRELVEGSAGSNIGLRYLDGAFNFDARAAGEFISAELAAAIVWLDAYTTNPDRTARNPNLLIWDRRPWLIDHGSALYAHHAWDSTDDERTRTSFPLIRNHVLLLHAADLAHADERLGAQLEGDTVARVVAGVPDDLLMDPLARGAFGSAGEARDRYRRYLVRRLEPPRAFVAEAARAQTERRAGKPRRLEARR
jgi:hypothetical protein